MYFLLNAICLFMPAHWFVSWTGGRRQGAHGLYDFLSYPQQPSRIPCLTAQPIALQLKKIETAADVKFGVLYQHDVSPSHHLLGTRRYQHHVSLGSGGD